MCIEFQKIEYEYVSLGAEFTDDKSCRSHFKEQRDKQGVVCKRCQGTDHYWLINKWSYQCKSCKSRTSLRSGIIIESSTLSFTIEASEQAHKTQKSGRGSKKKSNVMIIAESTVLEDINTGK